MISCDNCSEGKPCCSKNKPCSIENLENIMDETELLEFNNTYNDFPYNYAKIAQ